MEDELPQELDHEQIRGMLRLFNGGKMYRQPRTGTRVPLLTMGSSILVAGAEWGDFAIDIEKGFLHEDGNVLSVKGKYCGREETWCFVRPGYKATNLAPLFG